MLSGELASRAKRLEREQAERLEKARVRADRERAVAERQRQREEARTEELRQRRLAQEAAREAVSRGLLEHASIAARARTASALKNLWRLLPGVMKRRSHVLAYPCRIANTLSRSWGWGSTRVVHGFAVQRAQGALYVARCR
jgi:hypothetical protein